jgi:uncharacterized protein DUF5681
MSENRPKTGRKAPRTAFLPGRSGNPGGRPKKTEEEFALVKACQDKSPIALAVIEKLMYEADKDSVRLSAAIFIIERGFGKTLEQIGRPGALDEWKTEELLAMRDEFRRRIAAEGLPNGPQPLALSHGASL